MKYNIIIPLWMYAFHKLLESFRCASFTLPLALEHLQDFIYYAYTFYTGLLEEPTLAMFKSGWLEALGNLARYRMAVSAMVTGSLRTGPALTTDAMSQVALATSTSVIIPDITKVKANSLGSKSLSDVPAA
jgi:protein SMG6